MPKSLEQRQWDIVGELQRTVGIMGPEAAKKALSLIEWHSKHGSLTKKQEAFAKALAMQARGEKAKRKKRKDCAHYLYAISDGCAVKLGYSHNVESRLKDMQTGQSANLRILWKLKVGASRAEAVVQERKLHRFCKRYRVRGEWFRLGCMDKVREFSVNERRRARIEEQQAQELEIVAEAIARI